MSRLTQGHVPPFVDSDGQNPDFFHPFIEPGTFDPDWQFFAPAEVGEFGGHPVAGDDYGVNYHGFAHSHMDGLMHFG